MIHHEIYESKQLRCNKDPDKLLMEPLYSIID